MPDLMSELDKNLHNVPIEDYFLGLAEQVLAVLRNDKEKLVKALDQRKKQIDFLTSDQENDKRTLLQVNGGLSVAISLTTKYRVKHQAHKNKSKRNRDERKAKRGRPRKNGHN